MGKLIDADICLEKAWQNFYKQEDEHEKNIDDYDILRDRFYEQSGFECCQQTIVNEQPVEAILKADYENRLKADLVAVLTELQLGVQEMDSGCGWEGYRPTAQVLEVIQQKINDLAVSSGLGKNSKKLEKDFGESDCISRADALDCVNMGISFCDVYKKINELPSVTPQEPRWISVSEKLPEPFTFVNATCRSLIDDRENWVVETIYLPIPKEVNKHGYSDWGNIPMLNLGEAEVIAWVERIIPQPYKVEVRDKE